MESRVRNRRRTDDVINSDPSSEPGEHWVGVYFNKRGRGEYFDSYGLSPTLIGLKSYMDAYSLSGWIYNRKTLQAYFSSFCGHYCVYFILFRCRGVPLHAIVSDFTSNLTETIALFLALYVIYQNIDCTHIDY